MSRKVKKNCVDCGKEYTCLVAMMTKQLRCAACQLKRDKALNIAYQRKRYYEKKKKHDQFLLSTENDGTAARETQLLCEPTGIPIYNWRW